MILFSFIGQAQDVLGKWKTIDDQTEEAKSIVEIYIKDRKVFSKIIIFFDETKHGYPCVGYYLKPTL